MEITSFNNQRQVYENPQLGRSLDYDPRVRKIPRPVNLINKPQPVVFQNLPEEEETEDEEQQFPNLQEPTQNAVYASQDEGFLKWLFDFRKEAIIPLRNAWRGLEYDFDTRKWIAPHGRKSNTVMNERGVAWGISLIESYMNPVYIVSDFDEKSYNFTMRECSSIIINKLCYSYTEFDLAKLDIMRVVEEIESKVRAILLGAKDNGYRDFFSTQHQTIESKSLSQEQTGNRGRGIFSSVTGIFKGMDKNRI